jgi:hypothetical protein
MKSKQQIAQFDSDLCINIAEIAGDSILLFQDASIDVPLSVKACANVGDITTYCCSDPAITVENVTCNGLLNETGNYTLTLDISVEIPVFLNVNASTDLSSVSFGGE